MWAVVHNRSANGASMGPNALASLLADGRWAR